MTLPSFLTFNAPWLGELPNPYNTKSPPAASPQSTSSSTSSRAFSTHAPSSQTSVTTSLGGYRGSSGEALKGSQLEQESNLLEENVPLGGVRTAGNTQWGTFAPEGRQHPRRTQRLCSRGSSGEDAALPPPSLIRQSARKVNFVDTLVDTATQMVETIWPLSAQVQSRHPNSCSRQPSKTELRYFIQEVLKRSKTSYSTLQVALYYLILIRPHVPRHDFTTEQPEDSSSSFSLQCGRRMFITALILASKYLQDRNFSASGWSKISGLSTWDVSVNEIAFLGAIDWRCHVPDQLFHRWQDIVLTYSPSAQCHGSLPSSRVSWKEVVLRLTPKLDSLELGDAELSDDSGYCSPGAESSMSPPPLPAQREPLIPTSDRPAPRPKISRLIPQWLASTPSASQTAVPSNGQRPTLPPLQPRLTPLPTPDLTPQSDPFCTPAASASGSRRSSMSRTMCQVQEAAHARCVLDRTSDWKPRVPEGFPALARRTSVTASASLVSSPDSTSDAASQYSGASSRPSRSSSISSVASSSCAFPQPPSLAVQATRRCAKMQLNTALTDATRPTELPGQLSWQEVCNTARGHNAHSIQGKQDRVANRTNTAVHHDPALRPTLSRTWEPTTSAEDQLAASALQDLALSRQSSLPSPRFLRRTGTAGSKRARPSSMEFGVEDAVRQPIAPRGLGDVTNMKADETQMKGKEVLSDEEVADSFLLRKEDKHATRQANRKPTKNNGAAMQSIAGGGCGGQPRKKACAGSERGGRGEARAALAENWLADMQ